MLKAPGTCEYEAFWATESIRVLLKKREMFVPCQKSNDSPLSHPGHILVTLLAMKNRKVYSETVISDYNQPLPL